MFKWIEPWVLFEVKRDGFQTLTIPATAEYKIVLVAPGTMKYFLNIEKADYPGVRIVGKFELKMGQKITVALGQQGNSDGCGSGGSFVVLESDEGPKPLLIAGGAGHTYIKAFGRGNTDQTTVGNRNVGTSGKQKFFHGDIEDVYCAGAGFHEAPRVSNLAKGCVAPKSYKEGLTGGKGVDENGRVYEGGFGGGGGCCHFERKINVYHPYWGIDTDWKGVSYYGAGGGFTGGGTKVDADGKNIWGEGGGSFSADPKAKIDHHFVQFGYCKIKKI